MKIQILFNRLKHAFESRRQNSILLSSPPWPPTPVSGLKSLTLLNEQRFLKMSPKGVEQQRNIGCQSEGHPS